MRILKLVVFLRSFGIENREKGWSEASSKADPECQKFLKARTYFCVSAVAVGIFNNYFR
jgi:hypothetical protein